jgi:hypothetical protein
MATNFDRFRKDLDALIAKGDLLETSAQAQFRSEQFERLIKKEYGDKAKDYLKSLPSFVREYQSWYSEAKALIRQLLPDRLADFVGHYEKPKSRKLMTLDAYRIEDCVLGFQATRTGSSGELEKVVGQEVAIPHFQQQLAILKSAQKRFASSLFDIRQLVQADLFDSELDAARELARNNFGRAAGAMAGVVLERHLTQVCDKHAILIAKKMPTISDLNDALKAADIIDLPQWRFIQHLADTTS